MLLTHGYGKRLAVVVSGGAAVRMLSGTCRLIAVKSMTISMSLLPGTYVLVSPLDVPMLLCPCYAQRVEQAATVDSGLRW